MIGISDLEYLCAEVRQIARKAGAFLRDERQKFDRERVEEKSAHNYVSYVDKESERRLVEQLSTLLPEAGFIAEEGSGSLTDEEIRSTEPPTISMIWLLTVSVLPCGIGKNCC